MRSQMEICCRGMQFRSAVWAVAGASLATACLLSFDDSEIDSQNAVGGNTADASVGGAAGAAGGSGGGGTGGSSGAGGASGGSSGASGGAGGASGGGGLSGSGGSGGTTGGSGGSGGASGGSGGASGGSGGASGGTGGSTGLPPCGLGSDDFSDGTIGSLWGIWNTGHSEQGGVLRITPDAPTAMHSGMTTTTVANLSNCAVSVELVQVLSTLDSTSAYLLLQPEPFKQSDVTFIQWEEGNLYMGKEPVPAIQPYNAVSDRWFRIASSGGTTRMETSPDGKTWTTKHSISTPASYTAGRAELAAGSWKVQPSIGTAIFDNFNK